MLVNQAFLISGRKMPSSEDDLKLFLDGWSSALKAIPTDALKEAFSDALASGKPLTPGAVCQGYHEKMQVSREEIKRQSGPHENPFPLHAKLIEASSGRTYHFALKEPLCCLDCGRPAEAFRLGDQGRKLFFCFYHARIAAYQPSETVEEIPF